jgi:hypothetical protein
LGKRINFVGGSSGSWRAEEDQDMRRLVVGIAALSLMAVTAGFAGSGPVAAAPSTTKVFTANAYSYAAGHFFDGTFCVNGVIVSKPSTEQVLGPFTVASGSADVMFFDSDVANCTDLDPTAEATVDLPAAGSVTLMAYWGPTRAVVMLVNPLECVPAGAGRLTVRHGADDGVLVNLDVRGAGPDGVDKVLITGLAHGGQASAELPVGSYTNVRAVLPGTSMGGDPIGTVSVAAGVVTYEYLYGGNDGAIGSFFDSAKITTCAVVTTTTTAPPATAPPAVKATPAFTG